MAIPRSINLPGSRSRTQQYELAPGLAQYVQAVYVEVDNTSGATTRPLLTLSEQSGVVIAKKRQDAPIQGGTSDSATWALRLEADLSGVIRFDVDNIGNTLNIETDGLPGMLFFADGGGQLLLQSDDLIRIDSDGDFRQSVDGQALWDADEAIFNGGTVQITSQSGNMALVCVANTEIQADTLNVDTDGNYGVTVGGNYSEDITGNWINITNGAWTLNADNIGITAAVGGIVFGLPAGSALIVNDHLGNPIFKVNEDGSLQGKTGKALTFNL